VTHLLVQRWPLQRKMLGCAQVFPTECPGSGAIPGLGHVMIGSRSWIFAGFVEMNTVFLEVVV